jgi:hypothetical protein
MNLKYSTLTFKAAIRSVPTGPVVELPKKAKTTNLDADIQVIVGIWVKRSDQSGRRSSPVRELKEVGRLEGFEPSTS